MTIHCHIEDFRSLTLFEEIEKDTHACCVRISRHIENIPACGLIRERKFTQVQRLSSRIWLIDVQGVVAEIPIGEWSVKSHIVPDKRVLSLRWYIWSRCFICIVVNIFEPD
jgi:hypothetical protein